LEIYIYGCQIGLGYGDDKLMFGSEGCFLWAGWFLKVFLGWEVDDACLLILFIHRMFAMKFDLDGEIGVWWLFVMGVEGMS